MTRTVVGVFDDFGKAQAAIAELERCGYSEDDINLLTHESSQPASTSTTSTGADTSGDYSSGDYSGDAAGDITPGKGAMVGGVTGLLVGIGAALIPGIGPILAAGPISAAIGAGLGAVAGPVIDSMMDWGVPREDAELYAEALRRGNTVVAVQCADEDTGRCEGILRRQGAIDIDRQADQWRESGWSGYSADAPAYSDEEFARDRANRSAGTVDTDVKDNEGRTLEGEAATIPVVEEQLRVGKRMAGGRTVQVYTQTTERPVSAEVRLRQERVRVDRHPADRPATAAEAENFRDTRIELTENSEEAVVGKEARVVEEVNIGKDIEERVETVRDKVRRRDVRVKPEGDEQPRPRPHS